jgi:hypothetical protein
MLPHKSPLSISVFLYTCHIFHPSCRFCYLVSSRYEAPHCAIFSTFVSSLLSPSIFFLPHSWVQSGYVLPLMWGTKFQINIYSNTQNYKIVFLYFNLYSYIAVRMTKDSGPNSSRNFLNLMCSWLIDWLTLGSSPYSPNAPRPLMCSYFIHAYSH